MIDGYTKTALTVIAVALTAIAIRQAMPPSALAQLGAVDPCGTPADPCYVATPSNRPLLVSSY